MATQLIGGKPYEIYSPEWQAAMDAYKVQQAGVAGTAAGTATGNEYTASTEAKRLYDLSHPSVQSQEGQIQFQTGQDTQRRQQLQNQQAFTTTQENNQIGQQEQQAQFGINKAQTDQQMAGEQAHQASLTALRNLLMTQVRQ